MTGFARQERTGAFGSVICEIRSVNHRFLDAAVRLPDSCRELESELRQRLTRELRRGKVDCTIQHRPPVAGELQMDEVRAHATARAQPPDRRADPRTRDQINVLELLRWPGVLREEQTDIEALHAGGARGVRRHAAEPERRARTRGSDGSANSSCSVAMRSPR